MVLARSLFLRFNAIDNREAQRILEEALRIDPNYTGAMVQLGLTYWWEVRSNISADREERLGLAERQAEKALGIDPAMGSACMLRGLCVWLRDQHAEAIRLCEKAIDLAPSDSWATAALGFVYVYAGESERAVATLKTAMRLSPHYPAWYGYAFALANLW